MKNQFKNGRRTLWIAGVGVVVLGFIAAAVILPMRAPVAGSDGPEIHTPSMQNVPGEGAPKLQIEVGSEEH